MLGIVHKLDINFKLDTDQVMAAHWFIKGASSPLGSSKNVRSNDGTSSEVGLAPLRKEARIAKVGVIFEKEGKEGEGTSSLGGEGRIDLRLRLELGLGFDGFFYYMVKISVEKSISIFGDENLAFLIHRFRQIKKPKERGGCGLVYKLKESGRPYLFANT
ncbi:hypothetical protein K2173_016365 [Erythroxylum novogranatense]|uniref:Uncharacterized protein n=1 Tax=Erythroxylum novogranatense TaxID=1862640 RepID=A0AAV8SGN9_9ROSI|nr:hypothetical protein K2173_016365 [Erythroxylum novogranatense]